MYKRRFKIEKVQRTLETSAKIIVDTQTGVQYLFTTDGLGSGLTLLVDKEGKPLIKITDNSSEIK